LFIDFEQENYYFAHQILQAIKGILWQTKNKGNRRVNNNPENLQTRHARPTVIGPGVFSVHRNQSINRNNLLWYRLRPVNRAPWQLRNDRKDRQLRNDLRNRDLSFRRENRMSRSLFRSLMRPSRSPIYRGFFVTHYNGIMEITK
jgi:hypothetical protein